ncbi:MAG TPA: hypothetical protein VG734_02690 [Lacunisphaera sp.]|nr:hypothetical protein [Lacunisphaera sp.]
MINFFYPYRPPNGVSALFVRLAQHLGARGDLHLRVIDFPDGFMARQLKPGGGVELRPFDSRGTVAIGAGEILVLQGELPYRLRRQLRIDAQARVIYWQLHPFNFVPQVLPLMGRGHWLTERPEVYRTIAGMTAARPLRKTRDFVRLLVRERSLFFMDGPNWRTTESYLGCKIADPILLPVALDVPENPRIRRVGEAALQVAWVGRLYDFKIHILCHTIRRLSDYAAATRTKVVYHVIGDGPLGRMLDEVEPAHDWFELIRVGDLEVGAMREYLRQRIDLLTAMGTAALEGAALGLPVLVVDIAYKPISTPYRYRWLHETPDFDLAHTITAADADPTGESLGNMITALKSDYAGIATAAHQYCRTHHSIAAVAERFLALLAESSLRFGEVPREIYAKGWLRRAYELARQ